MILFHFFKHRLLGGWEVNKTMARRITKLRPYKAFCAEKSGDVALSFVTSFGVPVSTTHATNRAIMGVGALRGSYSVHRGVVRQIITAWVLTIPVTAVTAFIFFISSTGQRDSDR